MLTKEQKELAKVIGNYFGADAGYLDISCLDLARTIAEAGWTKQEWISVNDRLPEEECRCLVIDAAGDIEMDCYDGKGRFVLDRSGAVQHPSHWMPLPKMPQPPKGE